MKAFSIEFMREMARGRTGKRLLVGLVVSLVALAPARIQATDQTANVATSAGFSNQLSQIMADWNSSHEPGTFEKTLQLCESIRQAGLAIPESRAVYLRAIRFILEAPTSGDLVSTVNSLKTKKTAVLMVSGDDLKQIPAPELNAYRAEVLKTLVAQSKQLQTQAMALQKEEPFYLNVAPPVSPGEPAIAGQSAEAIKDPAKRQAYLEAIQANQNKRSNTDKLRRVSAAASNQTQQIERFVLRNYPATTEARQEIQKTLAGGGFESQQIEKLLGKVAAKAVEAK